MSDPQEVFQQIYSKRLWRSAESISGTGSTIANTSQIRKSIPLLLKKFNIQSILDLPCGDFNWMQRIDLSDIYYTGADLIQDLVEKNKRYEKENISFLTLNLLEDKLPSCDLILVRDCLVHLSFEDLEKAIANIKRSKCVYLLTTSFIGHLKNENIQTGYWRPLNLQGPPVNFPSPLEILADHGQGKFYDKSLLLWEVKDL